MALTPRVICLMGPTASGKSAMAALLARTLPVEIVSVDSALVYRGMDIGTAKPSLAERAAIPHHLIDILEPKGRYSAARFALDASASIADILSRGRTPLLVGGTMLYFRALWHGLNEMPPANPSVRSAIETEARRVGWPALHDELMQVDAPTALRLAPNDAQRIQRALEVYRVSGLPLSSFHLADRQRPNVPWRYERIALEPSDRLGLHARITQRFDTMLEHGFLNEVQGLMQQDGLSRDLPAMRSVGYRQAWEHLAGEIDFGTMREKALAATRQLAKHQLTWLRATPDRIVIDCQANDMGTQVERAVKAALGEKDRT